MKKVLLLPGVLVFLVCALVATAALVTTGTQSPVPQKTMYSIASQSYVTQGKTFLQNHDILNAREQFRLAVAQDATDQEANLLYGVTRVLAVFEDTYSTPAGGLSSVREIFEKAGFTITVYGLYHSEMTDPQDGPASTTPRTGAILDFIKAKALPEIDGAIGNLAAVTNAGFTSVIKPAAVGSMTTDDINVDYADVRVLLAMLQVAKCNLNLMMVYGLDVSLPDVGSPDQLMTYKTLFADTNFLAVKDAARLTTAKSALTSFIDTYTAAVPVLTGTRTSTRHLFVVDAPIPGDPGPSQADELNDIANKLGEIKLSLSGSHLFTGSASVENRTIDLSKAFDAGNPINIRAGIANCGSSTFIADATISGLFPLGLTGLEKVRTETGPDVLGVVCTGKEKPLIDLEGAGSLYYSSGYSVTSIPVTISNHGTAPLTVSSAVLGGLDSGRLTLGAGACGSLTPTIQPGTSCDLAVNLKLPPTSYGGLNAYLTVASNDITHSSVTKDIWGYVQPPPGGPISGVVKDGVTLAGIGGIPVEAYNEYGYMQASTTTAGGTGAYTLSGLTSGTYKIRFGTSNGYISQWYNNKTTQNSADPVTLTPDGVSLGNTLLGKGATISGKVKDAQSQVNIAGIDVNIYNNQTHEQVAYGQTDSNGFSLSGLPTGTYDVSVGNYSYVTQWIYGVSVTAPNTTTLADFSLQPAGSISGFVKDASTQQGISNISVNVYDAQTGMNIRSIGTNYGGDYFIGGLAPGSYKLRFTGFDQNYLEKWYNGKSSMGTADLVTVSAASTTMVADALMSRGGMISGQVKNISSAPLQGVMVSAYNVVNNTFITSVMTDPWGMYMIGGLPAGAYKIGFNGGYSGYQNRWYNDSKSNAGAQPVAVTVPNETAGVNATLGVAGKISGRVTGSGTTSGINVSATDADGFNGFSWGTTTDNSGNYTISGLPPGSYRVYFNGSPQGYVSEYLTDKRDLGAADLVTVTAAATTPGIDAALAGGRSISGKVTTGGASPISGLTVTVFDVNDNQVAVATTDSSGNYQANGVPSGKNKLRFNGPNKGFVNQVYNGKLYMSEAQVVTVSPYSVTPGINATLAAGGTMAGTVTDAGGLPIAGVNVAVYDTNSGVISNTTTDVNGNYTAPGIPAGTFKVLFSAGGRYAARWSGNAASFAAATPITVATVTATTGVHAQLGTGPRASFPGNSRVFGGVPVGSSTTYRNLTVNNFGTSPLTIGTLGLSGPDAAEFSLQNDSCSGRTVPPGGNCTFHVNLSAVSTVLKQAQISIPSNDPDNPTLVINVSGTGMYTQPITFNPPATATYGDPPITLTATGGGSGNPVVFTIESGPGTLSGTNNSVLTITGPGTISIKASQAGSSTYFAGEVKRSIVVAAPAKWKLTVNMTGPGNVNSNPSGIACTGGSCSNSFDAAKSVSLSATVSNSTFNGWSGACTGTGPCSVFMDSEKTVNAVFTANPAAALIEGDSTPYYNLDAVLYAVTVPGKTVRAKDQIFGENVIVTRSAPVTLKGGYTDTLLTTRTTTSRTVIDGTLKVRAGALRVDRLAVR